MVFGADRNILTFLLELLNLLLRSTNTGKQLFLQASGFLKGSESKVYDACMKSVRQVYDECTMSVR